MQGTWSSVSDKLSKVLWGNIHFKAFIMWPDSHAQTSRIIGSVIVVNDERANMVGRPLQELQRFIIFQADILDLALMKNRNCHVTPDPQYLAVKHYDPKLWNQLQITLNTVLLHRCWLHPLIDPPQVEMFLKIILYSQLWPSACVTYISWTSAKQGHGGIKNPTTS